MLFLKIIKNIVSLFVITMIVGFSYNAYGSTFMQVPNDTQKTALSHMETLGVIDKLSNSSADINKTVSRDVFAKMLVIAAGLQNTADSLKYQSIFPDVKANNMAGYVNTAVGKNFLTGLADRKFHPDQNIAFAQVCTATVRALGFVDSDVTGVWPQNYIDKAKALKLIDGISLKNNDGVSRVIAATIIDRALNTNIKKASLQDADKTLLSSGGVFTDCIILGTKNTSNRLDNNQILTDQGIYYTLNAKTSFIVGNKYRLLLDGDKIKKVCYTLKILKNIVIDSVDITKVTYNEKNNKVIMTLPDKVTYYYDGVKQTYANLSTILPTASSVTFAYNDDKVGFEYGVINSLALTGYSDYIILGNGATSVRLDNNQILTDKGILYLDDKTIKIEVGHKYRMLIDSNDNILKVNKDLRTVKNIKVASITNSADGTLNNVITYSENGKSINMTLPDKVIYYKDGTKLTYNDALTALQGDTSVVFGNNGNNVGYEYGVILTNSQGSFADYIILGNSQTSVRLNSNQILTDKGIFYLADQNIKVEVGHMYRMLINNNNIMKVDKDERTVLNIKVDSITKSSDGTLNNVVNYTDNGKSVMMTLPDKVDYYKDGTKLTYATALTSLQGDTSLIFANTQNNIGYEYAVILTNSNGVYDNYVVLGNFHTINSLEQNQVLTDKGILYLKDNKTTLNIGNKYRLLVYNDTIENVQTSSYTYKSVVVSSISGTNVTYMDNKAQANMVLPDKVIYYYQGIKQTYDSIKNIIQGESTIIFANSTDTLGYEYAVIIDPTYSKAVIAAGVKIGDTRIGSINLSAGELITKNSDYITLADIKDGDTVYEVSDINNSNKYILVLESSVSGVLTAILPNRIYPKTIQIDSKNYDISNDLNISKLSSDNSQFKIDDKVQISLGYDGKVVDISYPGASNNANYAMVLSTSSTIVANTSSTSTTLFYAKLLKADGTTDIYKVDTDPVFLKGKLVTFTILNDGLYQLSPVTYINSPESTVSQMDNQIGNNFITDNAAIFNIVPSDSGDADVKLLKLSDLNLMTLAAGKIMYVNNSGTFGDANVVLINDAFDKQYTPGIITSSDYTGKRGAAYTLSIRVGTTNYSYNYAYGYPNFSEVMVKISNGQITNLMYQQNANDQTIKIQAINLERIMLNSYIYKFASNLTIYYRDSMGNITVKSATDIDITKIYTNVSIFLDKPLSSGGKVRTIVVIE